MVSILVVVLAASCASVRRTAPPSIEEGPREMAREERTAAGEAEVKPLAPGDVRITVVSDVAAPAYRLWDEGKEIGVIEGGDSLQWDRPGGVVVLVAEPFNHNDDTVRFAGLLVPGEREVLLGPDDDGTLAFLGGAPAKLSDARRIERLRRRAELLSQELAADYLRERLFAAPAPGRLRSAYADTEQEIETGEHGPLLRWTRFQSSRASMLKSADGRLAGHRQAFEHAFADFTDATIRIVVTARVALQRNPRDIKPVRAFFRLGNDGPLGASSESLLVALMACCAKESVD